MRALAIASLCAVLVAPSVLPFGVDAPSRPDTPSGPETIVEPDPDEPPTCATGCAAAQDTLPALTAFEYARLLELMRAEPLTGDNEALETLLFHGERTRELMEAHGTEELDEEQNAFLERELARDHVRLEVRLVTEDGRERAHLGPVRVPLGEKQHLHPENTTDLTPPEISGTVRRVGLNHLWTRL
jgi:hypothetical protein